MDGAGIGRTPGLDGCAGHALQDAEDDLRCGCGNLVARLVDGEIELKCRRCKRVLVVRLAPGPRPGLFRLVERTRLDSQNSRMAGCGH